MKTKVRSKIIRKYIFSTVSTSLFTKSHSHLLQLKYKRFSKVMVVTLKSTIAAMRARARAREISCTCAAVTLYHACACARAKLNNLLGGVIGGLPGL